MAFTCGFSDGFSNGFAICLSVGVGPIVISPAYRFEGDPAFTMIVTGSGYTGASIVNINGIARATTLINSTTLSVAVLATDLASIGVLPVTVSGAGAGGPSYLTVYAALQPQGGRIVTVRPEEDHLYDVRAGTNLFKDALAADSTVRRVLRN